MTDRIVIGLSGSDHTHPAVEWGVDYAITHGLRIDLVHVVDTTWGLPDADYVPQAIVAAEDRITFEADRISSNHPGSAVHGEVLTGSPDRELIAHARDARVLVVGSHPTDAFGGGELYSRRASRIAELAECSVVVVPSTPEPAVGAGVVVGVDGSELSMKALRFGADVADRFGEPLTAVHAWVSPWPWGFDAGERRETPPPEDELVLAEAVAGLASDFPDLAVHRSLPREAPASALYAAARGARLLAVGSHGRNALGRIWFGSVSTDVLLSMPCPVAIVR